MSFEKSVSGAPIVRSLPVNDSLPGKPAASSAAVRQSADEVADLCLQFRRVVSPAAVDFPASALDPVPRAAHHAGPTGVARRVRRKALRCTVVATWPAGRHGG